VVIVGLSALLRNQSFLVCGVHPSGSMPASGSSVNSGSHVTTTVDANKVGHVHFEVVWDFD
jgi:hypothetical protein